TRLKSKLRSFFVNDKNDPILRESVVSGDLAAIKFCKMSSQDTVAEEEREATNSNINEENQLEALGAETDAFQCGYCKQRKCRYRKAHDEPISTVRAIIH
ncbi:hypothetical protein FOMPIDRAFT_61112, partial [Fomitopsis schrenkii]